MSSTSNVQWRSWLVGAGLGSDAGLAGKAVQGAAAFTFDVLPAAQGQSLCCSRHHELWRPQDERHLELRHARTSSLQRYQFLILLRATRGLFVFPPQYRGSLVGSVEEKKSVGARARLEQGLCALQGMAT